MSSGGKGSSPRPFSVDQKTFDSNWDLIFKNKDLPVTEEEEEAWKELEEKTTSARERNSTPTSS